MLGVVGVALRNGVGEACVWCLQTQDAEMIAGARASQEPTWALRALVLWWVSTDIPTSIAAVHLTVLMTL